MRFLLLSTDYRAFLDWHYAQHPGLADQSYQHQAKARAESLFGLADFYSGNLQKLGHEAWDVDFNNAFMQRAWAREHGLEVNGGGRWQFRMRRGVVPWLTRTDDHRWLYDVLRAQIKAYRPDVFLNHWIGLETGFIREIKPHVGLVVGSHASPLQGRTDLSVYDLMLSAVDNFVDYFRREGVKSELFRFGFEPKVLTRFTRLERSIPVSFVGNIFQQHVSRARWLDHVCHNVSVDVWAPSLGSFPDESSVKRRHRGAAWGGQMFDILGRSRITLNHHIDVAEAYAGNVRLFEATGCGCLLVTDWKKNLHEMFEPGKEVVAYKSDEECVEMVQHYLEHPDEADAIARAGQQRALRDHTFNKRMEELSGIVERYM